MNWAGKGGGVYPSMHWARGVCVSQYALGGGVCLGGVSQGGCLPGGVRLGGAPAQGRVADTPL